MGSNTTQLYNEMGVSDVPLPYVFKAHWLIRLAALPMMFLWVLAFFHRHETYQLWADSGWLFRACLLFTAVFVPVGALQVFIERAVFTHEGIESRNPLGITKFRSYADVERVVLKAGYLEISFQDGSRIKILQGTGDIKKAIHILRTHMSCKS